MDSEQEEKLVWGALDACQRTAYALVPPSVDRSTDMLWDAALEVVNVIVDASIDLLGTEAQT